MTERREWQPAGQDPRFLAAWERINPGTDPPRAFVHRNGLTAMVGREVWRDGSERWHVSLRYGNPGKNGRVPTWDELVDALHALRPGVPFVVGVPPRSWWMNVHPDVLHAWETHDAGLVAEWKENATGQAPT